MKPTRLLMPRIEYILLMAIFWGIASTGPTLLNSDGDLPRHLLVGRLIRETRAVHQTDIFSFRTTGYPSIPHEWLAQVLLSLFNDWLGLGGVVLFTTTLITAVWWILFRQAMHKSNSLLASVLFTALGVGASLIHVLPRPHIFSYLMIALWIIILERIKTGTTRHWWQLPLLMLAWVNLHGMFILGIAIWLLHLMGGFLDHPSREWLKQRETKNLIAGGSASVIATFFSPTGFKIWEAIASLGGNAYIKSRIPEYQPANFHMPETWPFILILLLLLAGLSRSDQKTSYIDLLMISAFAGLALYASRMLPIFAIVSTPYATQIVARWLRQDFSSSRVWGIEQNINTINENSGGLIWMAAVFLTVVFLFKANISIDPANKGNHFDPEFFPVAAVNWLEANPQNGHMFNDFDWGGYILLTLWPRYPIFMDGHTHIYGEALTREYETVITVSADWQSIFEKYQIEWAIVRADSQIAQALDTAHWNTLYKDDTALIVRHP